MQIGKVLKSTGKWYIVELEEGQKVTARIRGKLKMGSLKTTNPIAVGDTVELDDFTDNEGTRRIHTVLDRKNYLARKSVNLSKQMHILAANIDRIYLTVTLRFPETQLAFIDRFLVSAESFRIPTTILFNKIDLYNEDDMEYLHALQFMYEEVGYPCVAMSMNDKDKIASLRNEIIGHQVIIAGNSGVGKSTLINKLDATLKIKTQAISASHLQGQHTTTFAEMHELSTGGYIIDTPGIRSFGIVDLEKEHIAHYFPEMRKLLGHCKFHNCLHINEPRCAIKQAVEEGAIFESRYETYLQLMNDNPNEVYRKNIYEV